MRVPFRREDFGWVVISIGMGIGAGIAMLPVEVGIKGLGIFLIAAVVGYPTMFLFQRLFINSLMGSRSAEDYTAIVSHYLGRNVGIAIGADTVAYRISPAEIENAGRVRVALNYQSLPPYYLRDVFVSSAGKHSETLFHLVGRTRTEATPIEDWKITITEADAPVPQ